MPDSKSITLKQLQKLISPINVNLISLKQGQKDLIERVSGLEQGQNKLIERVSGLEQGQEELINRVNRLEQGQDQLIDRVGGLEQGQNSLKIEQKKLNKKIGDLSNKMIEKQNMIIGFFDRDHLDLKKRVDCIEDRLYISH